MECIHGRVSEQRDLGCHKISKLVPEKTSEKMHLRFFKLLQHSQIMVKTKSVFSGWEVNVKTTFILDKWARASCKL